MRLLRHAPLLLLGACQAPAPPAETAFDALVPKLVGDWLDDTSEPGALVHEQWQRLADGSFEGLGFVMVEQDTVFIERLAIRPEADGTMAYQVRVPSQNRGEEVSFRLSGCAGDSMVFENPAHDFPQRIVYAMQPDGTWQARVSGPGKEGGTRVLSYRFRPVDRN
jgi:hypothetical protein